MKNIKAGDIFTFDKATITVKSIEIINPFDIEYEVWLYSEWQDIETGEKREMSGNGISFAKRMEELGKI